jgi:hypothetical protein
MTIAILMGPRVSSAAVNAEVLVLHVLQTSHLKKVVATELQSVVDILFSIHRFPILQRALLGPSIANF